MSLCYALLSGEPKYATDLKKGEIWYRSMAEKYPENVGIAMGYGNILFNNKSYDEAIKMYEKATQLKPDLINAYTSIAMTYDWRRKNPAKACQYAQKILELVPENPYADYIIAGSIQDIDQKI
jgi:tetratricopeptide (TPR) repeat protein